MKPVVAGKSAWMSMAYDGHPLQGYSCIGQMEGGTAPRRDDEEALEAL